jgi:hypothetical protein
MTKTLRNVGVNCNNIRMREIVARAQMPITHHKIAIPR